MKELKITLKGKIKEVKGFTLIELMVVIAIIGILVTIVIVAIDPVKQIRNSQDARARSDLQGFKQAMQLYYNDNKFYPTADYYTANLTAGACWSMGGSCSGTIYMRSVPKSPKTGVAYLYATTTSCDNTATNGYCTDYTLVANLYDGSGDVATKYCSGGTFILGANYEVCND